jgi:hypothetical protein
MVKQQLKQQIIFVKAELLPEQKEIAFSPIQSDLNGRSVLKSLKVR